LAGLLKNLLLAAPSSSTLRPASVAAARRLFSTHGDPFNRDNDYYVESIGDELLFYHQLHARVFANPMFSRAGGTSKIRAGTQFFRPARLLAMVLRILWLVDHLIYMHAACGWWVSKQDENAVQVKVQMPGLSAEHVKVRADPKGLFIKGEGVKDPDDVQEPARYSCRIDFSADSFRVNQARAEMKDGVLKVTVPRVKEDLGDCTEIKVC
jgi:HSP20 family protein